jgi:hypothetical protein
MAYAEASCRAVQAVSPGKLELSRKPLVDPPLVTSAYASRPVGAPEACARMTAGKSALSYGPHHAIVIPERVGALA